MLPFNEDKEKTKAKEQLDEGKRSMENELWIQMASNIDRIIDVIMEAWKPFTIRANVQ